MEKQSPDEDPVSYSESTHLVKPSTAGIIQTSKIQHIENSAPSEPTVKIRTYHWRWVVLFLYLLSNAFVNVIWIPSAPIADVVSCYYNVSLFWVNALSQVFMLSYVVLLAVVIWMLDKYGLSVCLAITTCFNAAGAALKLAGTGPHYFWLTMFGQTLGSVANVFVWTAAPLLSEVWFPAHERATATAIGGAIAPQLGLLFGLGLTPFIVHSDEELQFAVCGNATSPPTANPEEKQKWSEFIYYRFLYFNIGVLALGLFIYILTLIGFRDAPPTPPSISRKLKSEHEQLTGFQHLKKFLVTTIKSFKNIYFVMYMIIAAIIVAVYSTIASVINEVVHPYFPDYDEQIGYLGITAQATSLLAMFAVGRVLDWTKAFYVVNLVVCLLSLLCSIAWAVLILFQSNFYLLYIPAVLLGLSMASFSAVGYEYAIEMSYPLPEGTSAGLINVGSQVISIGVISLVGHFADPKVNNVQVGLWSMVGLVGLSCVLSLLVRPELRRVKIDRK